jgi:hypothetical protein
MKTSAKIITLLGLSTFSSARTLSQFSQQTIVDQVADLISSADQDQSE